MNLLAKKFGPLILVILSALMVISCEDPGKIGLIVNADNGIIATDYQDIVLSTSVVQFNPRKTLESKSIQAGQYYNPDFGTITSKSYTQLGVTPTISVAENAQYKSFELAISFASLIGEDLVNSETQQIDIYRLAEPIDTTTNYTRLDELDLMPTRLGTWIFAPLRNDTLQDDSDTTFILQLDDIVGEELFQKLKSNDPVFDSEAAFNEYFRGIAFVPAGNNKNIFQMDASRLIFVLRYNEFNSDGTPIERSYDLLIGRYGFHHIDSDKAGTPLSGITPDNTDFYPGNDYRYLQYGTLMAIKADIRPVYKLLDTLGFMIVNKAELFIDDVKQYGDYMVPPAFLQVYFTDSITNQWPVVDDIGRLDSGSIGQNFVMLQDEEKFAPPGFYGSPLSTFYDPDNHNYRFNMSVFFQNYYNGDFYDENLPFLEEQGHIFIFGESDVLLPQGKGSHVFSTPLAVPKNNIRLRIYYTIPTNQN